MKNLVVALLFVGAVSCTTTKNKVIKTTDSTSETRTVEVTRVDTVLVVPARLDSVVAELKRLYAGIDIGGSEVRYDTTRQTFYLNTPIKYIPYFVNKTIYRTQKITTKVKDKNIDIERSVNWKLYLVAVGILILIILFLLK